MFSRITLTISRIRTDIAGSVMQCTVARCNSALLTGDGRIEKGGLQAETQTITF